MTHIAQDEHPYIEPSQPSKNKRIYIEFMGKTQCMAEWSRELGIPESTINIRFRKKLPPNLIFEKKRYSHESIFPGRMFERWTVISLIKDSRRTWVLCRCVCGGQQKIRADQLLSGMSEGCGKCYYDKIRGSVAYNSKSHGCIIGNYFYQLAKGARRRGIEFQLNIVEISELLEKQKFICALSGDVITAPGHKKGDKSTPSGSASLDRIDPEKGYFIENVQWVHKDINRLKNDYSESDLLCMARKLVAHADLKLAA